MTAQDLTALADKLDELAMKATPGKIDWHRRYTNDDGSEERNGSVFASVREGTATAIAMQPKYTVYPQWEADASLIAATLNNLPTLTTALREAARLREALEKIANHATGGVGGNPAGFVQFARAALESPRG